MAHQIMYHYSYIDVYMYVSHFEHRTNMIFTQNITYNPSTSEDLYDIS